ncbi:uncharacterized protein LOC114735413 isoform X2 [Neltuma alba]|nr:uncharacterized protein LOC114735413 isoform X2 [Prosopis alba]
MLRKGFTKPKLLMNLNLILKRPRKLAGKAIANLISHHHHHHHGAAAASHDAQLQLSTPRGDEYEFSCSNTPNYSFFSKRDPCQFFACAHAPLTLDDDTAAVNDALKVALEMVGDKKGKDVVVEASPALHWSGRTRAVRKVRITDSPFPVTDGDDDGKHQVDEAAEVFINMFYKELRTQG